MKDEENRDFFRLSPLGDKTPVTNSEKTYTNWGGRTSLSLRIQDSVPPFKNLIEWWD